MHEYRDRPKRVKVKVIEDEKLPTHINLGEVMQPRERVVPAKQTSKQSEPDWRDKYLRLAADLDNSKKRLKRNYEQELRREQEELLLGFLEVADNLERASSQAKVSSEAMVEGIEAIQRQFQRTLAKYDVQSFDPVGQPFDPEKHEAISVIRQPGLPPNTVAKVTQTGYSMGDKLLRPAKVIVTADH